MKKCDLKEYDDGNIHVDFIYGNVKKLKFIHGPSNRIRDDNLNL